MKRLLILSAAALLFATTSNAQGWEDALKKAATSVADKATDGKLTAAALHGQWRYSGPGVKFEGGDLASEVGGAAIETTVAKYLSKGYAMAGIKPGACAFTFANDNTFTATMGTHALSGTFEFDASKHLITLHFAKGKTNLGTLPGHAYLSGGELALVFPVTKLVEMVTKLGTHVESLQAAVTVLEKYKDVYVGFAFGK